MRAPLTRVRQGPARLVSMAAAFLLAGCASGLFASVQERLCERSLDLLSLLDDQKFQEAASFFHVPESYSFTQAEWEQGGIAALLGTIVGELGSLRDVRRVSEPRGLIVYWVTSVTPPYWAGLEANHPHFQDYRVPPPRIRGMERVHVKAKTGSSGEVFITITYARTGRRWDVAMMQFGQPGRDQDAVARMGRMATAGAATVERYFIDHPPPER